MAGGEPDDGSTSSGSATAVASPGGVPPLVQIVSITEVDDACKLAAALLCSQFVAVESGHCYGLVLRCGLQEAGQGHGVYSIEQEGHGRCVGLWFMEFERGRHYVLVGPAKGGGPSVPLLDIMTQVARDRHRRDPIYQTPVKTDPRNAVAFADRTDPRAIGMPLDAQREVLRVVDVFDLVDDWSLSDALRRSQYIALKGDWRKLGDRLSLEAAVRRNEFWLRRYPRVVGIRVTHTPTLGTYTFVGPSDNKKGAVPVRQLVALLLVDLQATHALAEQTWGRAFDLGYDANPGALTGKRLLEELMARDGQAAQERQLEPHRGAAVAHSHKSWARYLLRACCCGSGGGGRAAGRAGPACYSA
jgi:hypothetical protein